MRFSSFFLAKGVTKTTAARLSAELHGQCPWFDFVHEVDTSIGRELLADVGNQPWSAHATADELIHWYNKSVWQNSYARIRADELNAAYVDLCELIGHFGKEDAFGDGDFWVVSDSFSEGAPSIVSFLQTHLAPGLQPALQGWKASHICIRQVTITNPDGDVLATV